MKIALAALVAVALATPAMAFDVKWGGDFNNRFSVITDSALFTNSGISSDSGNYYNINATPNRNNAFQKKEGDSDFFGDIKYRGILTATDDDKKVKGVLGIELGSRKYGAAGANFGGDDRDTLELMHAYTDFEVPFDKAARLTLGLQPVGFNKFVWSDNAGGVKYSATRGDLSYSLGWFRNDVAATFVNEDKNNYDDVYGLDVVYKVSPAVKLNAFVLYAEYGNQAVGTMTPAVAGTAAVTAQVPVLDSAGTQVYTDVDGSGTFTPGDILQTTTVTVTPAVAGVPAETASGMDQEIWYGIAADAQAGPLFFGGTAIYLDGEVDGKTSMGNKFTYDRDAFLVNAEVSTKIDAAKLKLGYLYTSGDDDATDNQLENFDSIDVYMAGFGSAVLFPNLADDNAPINGPYVQDKGLSLAYLGADIDLNDKASVGASYLWWNTAEDLDGPDADAKGKKDLGHEVAVRGSYKIATGLTAAVNAGYLFSGDAMDELYGGKGVADDIFRADAGFRFKF